MATIQPSALAQGESSEPTIRKDSIIASVYNYSATEWTPKFDFEVNKPISKDNRIWVEVFYPGRKNRLTAECDRNYAGADRVAFQCKGPYDAANLNTFLGLVDFEIHLANELYGKNLVLFRGKMKVVKGIDYQGQSSHFYVDVDWRIPIGYLYHNGESLVFEFWWFGEDAGHDLVSYLFHEGKVIAKADLCGDRPVLCSFRTDKGGTITALGPGAYEIKVLKEGRLKRTATFTVNEDGSYDNESPAPLASAVTK